MKLVEVAYFVDDVMETAAFYRRLLGTEPVAEGEGMAIFKLGEARLFLHRTYEPAPGDLPPEDHVAFAVSDVDAACARLQEQGLSVDRPPQDYYWGRSAYLRDPAGQLIELLQTQS